MRASRLLILAFISVIETTRADNPANRQISHGSSVPHRSPKSPSTNSGAVDERTNDSPDEIQEKMFNGRRYRHKKNHRWPDAVRYGKPHRGSRRRRRPKKMHLAGTRPTKGRSRNPRYSQRPSRYLEPPGSIESTYELYSPREIPLADQPIGSEPTRPTDGTDNHRLHGEGERVHAENIDRPVYIRDHAPEQLAGATDDIETDDAAITSREKSSPLPESPKDRIEFHVHGHEGPETYIFGYDTGVGNNRQYRLEERHEDGSVTGHYGYVDARGKLRKVRYKASPTQGYVEKLDHANKEEA